MDARSLEELGYPEYWDRRYATRPNESLLSTHEWFRTFEQLRPFLEKQLPAAGSSPRILHLGCGDSVRTPFYFSDISELRVEFYKYNLAVFFGF